MVQIAFPWVEEWIPDTSDEQTGDRDDEMHGWIGIQMLEPQQTIVSNTLTALENMA